MGIWKATVGRHKTPKAFANFSPGFELASTLGEPIDISCNPERVCLLANPFRVWASLSRIPRVVSNPGLKLANAFGV